MGWSTPGSWGSRGGWYAAVHVPPATTTLNPSDKGSSIILSGGNLVVNSSGATQPLVRSIASHSTGKYYYEVSCDTFSAAEVNVGICSGSEALTLGDLYGGTDRACYRVGDQVYFNSSGSAPPSAVGSGTFGIAVDLGAKVIWVTANGSTWTNSGNPATGAGGLSMAALSGGPWFAAAVLSTNVSTLTFNFGGSGYAFSASSGFANW